MSDTIADWILHGLRILVWKGSATSLGHRVKDEPFGLSPKSSSLIQNKSARPFSVHLRTPIHWPDGWGLGPGDAKGAIGATVNAHDGLKCPCKPRSDYPTSIAVPNALLSPS
jgi:hypothetical protein